MSLALVPSADDFAHDTERAVLAAILLTSGEALRECAAVSLEASHFLDARHHVLFRAMVAVRKAGRPVDPITLGNFLDGHPGALQRAGGKAYIGGLLDEIPHANSVAAHAMLVRRRARTREGHDDGRARDVQAAQVHDAQRFLDLPAEAFFRFPWPRVDAVTGGMAPGTLGFLAGHPGGGKTSVLLTLITRLVAEGKRVMYAGLETRPNRLRNQIAARTLGMDPGPIFAGVAQRYADWPATRDRLKAEVERQRTDARWTEHLRFSPQEHVDVKAAVEIMAEAKDFGAHLVVIDHIDHVTAEGRSAVQDAHAVVTVVDTLTKRHELATLAATQTNSEGDVRDPLLTHRPIAPKQVWMGKRKEQVAELFLSVYRPLRAEPPITAEERSALREGKGDLRRMLAAHTTAVHVFKARALGEGKGEVVRLGFWRGEVLDEVPKVVRDYPQATGAA